MEYDIHTAYNIPSPDPIHAGSYKELVFELKNPFNDVDVDLNNPTNIGSTEQPLIFRRKGKHFPRQPQKAESTKGAKVPVGTMRHS